MDIFCTQKPSMKKILTRFLMLQPSSSCTVTLCLVLMTGIQVTELPRLLMEHLLLHTEHLLLHMTLLLLPMVLLLLLTVLLPTLPTDTMYVIIIEFLILQTLIIACCRTHTLLMPPLLSVPTSTLLNSTPTTLKRLSRPLLARNPAPCHRHITCNLC